MQEKRNVSEHLYWNMHCCQTLMIGAFQNTEITEGGHHFTANTDNRGIRPACRRFAFIDPLGNDLLHIACMDIGTPVHLTGVQEFRDDIVEEWICLNCVEIQYLIQTGSRQGTVSQGD